MSQLQAIITPADKCSPVWQYVLIMNQDLIGQSEQIKALAAATQTVGVFWDEKTQEKNAEFLDEAVKTQAKFINEWRELIEESTGWKEKKKP